MTPVFASLQAQNYTSMAAETAPHLAEGMAVAIDGRIYADTLFQEIGPDSEVYVMPQIAGG